MATEEDELLVPLLTYLKSGVHIGTKIATKDMKKFIYKIRPDGLYVLNLKFTDERIRVAAKFLAKFEPNEVFVTSARIYGSQPVKKFSEVTGFIGYAGRPTPGILTNSHIEGYVEPLAVVISDPRVDKRVLKEAVDIGVPIVALCDTDNSLKYVDLAIPANNKGRHALALVFWLLSRQILREKGVIEMDGDLTVSFEDFKTRIGITVEETASG